ncbi:PREDICTED: WPP domain-containing protein 2-like [Tarenaya hassleriana]|uniref:WPP domain-containing protein 2-like n=1 Tax=Tarenaya hassleriana TaxID=28532 RepID=UPI00053C297E|nr:PREDICTED: WPP domain-containing protein 2-like [Tarenaya hassleriana]
MADTESTDNPAALPPSDSEGSAAVPHTDGDGATKDATMEKVEKKLGDVSLRIWPPTQKTRDAVVNRLIETLSTPSILSKRYGTLPQEDALAVAKSIEEEAYGVASAAVSGDDDGIEILQAYSKEISKRMLDSVKARAPAAATGNGNAGSAAQSGEDAGAVSTEAAKEDAPTESEKTEA